MLARLVSGAVFAVALSSCTREAAPVDRGTSTATITAVRARMSTRATIAIGRDFTVVGAGFQASLPVRARAPLHFGIDERHWIEVESDVAHDVAAVRTEDGVELPAVDTHTDAVWLAFADKVEEIRWLRDESAPTTHRWRLRRGPGIATLRLREGRIEALDARGSARLRSEPLLALDADGRSVPVTVRLEGETLVASLSTTGYRYPIALDPAWSTAKPMNVARLDHAAFKLANGKVVVIGGRAVDTIYASVEIYDPVADTWTLGAPMVTPRYGFVSGMMANGKIVAAGGRTTGHGITAGSELYDPATDKWTTTGSFPAAYVGRAFAHVPAIDRVLSLGGHDGGSALTGGGLYFDGANWTAGPGLSVARAYATAVSISATDLLVCGGGVSAPLDTCEIWSSAAAVKSVAALKVARKFFPMALVAGGTKVIAVGGSASDPMTTGIQAADIYDIASNTWTALPTPLAAHGANTATLLGTDRLLVVGGLTTTSEIFDVTQNTWSAAGVLSNPRLFHTTTVLPDGRVLLVGGRTTGSSYATPQPNVVFADNLAPGITCAQGGDCASGVCSDGVCCNRPCTGNCEACAEPGAIGTCTIITGAPRSGHPSCTGTGSCAGTCDGVSATCTFPGAAAACVAPSCAGGLYQPGARCDGAGECGALLSGVACAPYVCDATACKSTCTADADCVGAHKCIGTKCQLPSDGGVEDAGTDTGAVVPDTGTVVVPGDAGTPTKLPEKPTVGEGFTRCTKASDCATGNCVEGVCCDSPCTDRCHSCALLGSAGRCTVEPVGVDLKNECGPALKCIGTCDGSGSCIGAVSGTVCARNHCTGTSTGIGPAYCSAPGAACTTDDAVPFDCLPYACDPIFGACLAICTDSSQCANGYVCDAPTKTCVAGALPDEDSGCALNTTGRGTRFGALAMLAALVAVGRRRRAR